MITLIRSFGTSNAVARLQSEPLFAGLQGLEPSRVQRAIPINGTVRLRRPSHLVIHYNDDPAVKMARAIKHASGCKVICLSADIYGLDRYANLAEFVDLFTVPTIAHREILESALWVPVAVLPEGVDPIALPPAGALAQDVAQAGRICWFGYPESFQKSLIRIVDRAIQESGMSRGEIGLITDTRNQVCAGGRHLPFSPDSFYAMTSESTYALLSHFAYDLHVNTLIKSPNKLITSLVRGMTPIVSMTRNYLPFIEEFGLQNHAFRNGSELAKRLREARTEAGLGDNLVAIRQELLARFSPEALARHFLELI